VETIKGTESLCPVCFKKISAKIIKKGKNVYITKKCNLHGSFKFLIEKDFGIYKKLMNKNYHQFRFTKLIIPVTSKCNLRCPICFYYPCKDKNLPLEEIEKIAMNKNLPIFISGGEPTIRNDLPKMIDVIKQKNSIILVTNGLRFSDYDYALKIKKSGLKYVLFSFNGFDDKIYKKINGRALLRTKLRALRNLKEVDIKIILSTLVVRGLNENQIKKIFDFYVKNRSFIREMRVRSMISTGRYLRRKKLYLSELLNIVCSNIGIDKKEVFDELEFWKLVKKFLTKKEFIHRPCSLEFHLKIKDKRAIPIAREINLKKISNFRFKRLILLYYLFKIFGIKMFFKWIKTKFDFTSTLFETDKFLLIDLRSWPSKHDVDLQEISNCGTGYFMQNKIFSFCYYNIIKEAKITPDIHFE